MKAKFLTLLLISLGFLVGSASASTITVNVSGTDYTLTTIVGTFADNEALLKSQAWWNDETLAFALITEVKGGLGFPHVGSGHLSPFMAITDTRFPSGNIYTTMWRMSDDSRLELAIGPNDSHFFGSINPSPITWIVAGTVPEAGVTALYVLGAMVGAAVLRRRLQQPVA